MPPSPRRWRRTLLAGVAALACAGDLGCATAGATGRPPAAATELERPLRQAGGSSRPPAANGEAAGGSIDSVLASARAAVGGPTEDCAGFVESLFARAGLDLLAEARAGDNGVRALARYVKRRGRWHTRKLPAPGDLVFFHNSYDRDRDGRLDDLFTHVGVVAEVGADGTAQVIHATNHGVVREPMNLLHPHQARDERGRPINAALRRKRAHEPAGTPHLMSELFAGFGSVLEPRLAAARRARRRRSGS